MSAAEARIVSQLASLTGLDQGSIKEQVLPYLQTLKSGDEIKEHLQGLLGDSPASAALIRDVAASRGLSLASSSKAPAPAPAAEAPVRAPRPIVAGFNDEPKVRKPKAGKKKNIGLLAPRTVTSSGPAGAGADSSGGDALAGAFGSTGSIYRKDKGYEDLESQYAPKAKAAATTVKAASSASTPNAHTPVGSRPQSRQGGATGASAPSDPSGPSAASSATAAGSAPAAPPAEPPKEKITPTADMLELDEQMAQLTATTPARADEYGGKRVVCFCGGRVHGAHALVPMCRACHLVVCARTEPSPLHATASRCASCGLSPLLSDGARGALLARLAARRDALEDAERERIRLLRAERERTRASRADEAQRQAGLFPELASISSAEAARRQHAAHALGRGTAAAQAQAQHKSHKVLSLDFKTHTVREQRPVKPKAAKPSGAASGASSAKGAGDDAMDVDGEHADADGAGGVEILVADESDDGWAQYASAPAAASSIARTPRRGDPDVEALLAKRPWANWRRLRAVQGQSGDGLPSYIPPEKRDWTPPPWSSRAQALRTRAQRAGQERAEAAAENAGASAGPQGAGQDKGKGKGKGKEAAGAGAGAKGSAGEPRRAVPGSAAPPSEGSAGKKGKGRRGKARDGGASGAASASASTSGAASAAEAP